jgi:hypothetical protein
LIKKDPEADVLQALASQVRNYGPDSRIRRLIGIVAAPGADDAVEGTAWAEIKAMRLDEPTMAVVQEDFIRARESRGVHRNMASGPVPEGRPVPRNQAQPPESPGFFESIFGR